MNSYDLQNKMMDKFLDKLFEKRPPLTAEEMDDLNEQEHNNGVLMVWETVAGFKKMIICQVGKKDSLIKIGQILSANGYDAEVTNE
jgi:hypothetical protein